MANQKNKPATYEELTLSNMYSIEAIMRLLEKKGLLSEKEVLDEILIIRKEQADKNKTN